MSCPFTVSTQTWVLPPDVSVILGCDPRRGTRVTWFNISVLITGSTFFFTNHWSISYQVLTQWPVQSSPSYFVRHLLPRRIELSYPFVIRTVGLFVRFSRLRPWFRSFVGMSSPSFWVTGTFVRSQTTLNLSSELMRYRPYKNKILVYRSDGTFVDRWRTTTSYLSVLSPSSVGSLVSSINPRLTLLPPLTF